MGLFDVYSLLNIEPVRAKGAYLWDKNGEKYLDFYGGHAVISIGHCHPVYVDKISLQLNRIGFYSNAVVNPLQQELAGLLEKTSGYPDYNLFLHLPASFVRGLHASVIPDSHFRRYG